VCACTAKVALDVATCTLSMYLNPAQFHVLFG
jgi:hypothetical protein